MTGAPTCVLVAEGHHGLAEGLRGLLEAVFDCVLIVADERSLTESAERLAPALAIVDLALGRGDIGGLIARLRRRCPGVRVLVLGAPEESSVAELIVRSGADGFVTRRNIASDLLPAVDKLLESRSPDVSCAATDFQTEKVEE